MAICISIELLCRDHQVWQLCQWNINLLRMTKAQAHFQRNEAEVYLPLALNSHQIIITQRCRILYKISCQKYMITQMESMQRLFGKDIANHHPRNHSLAQPHKTTISIHPNNSFKISKHNPIKEDIKLKQNLTESLTEYFDESIGFMLSQENRQLPLNNYLQRQSGITESMRTTLFDWIVDVHLKLKMFPRTLYLITSIIDKYLSLRQVKRQQLQLVGAACLFIAAKYEQTYRVPQADQLVTISAKIFSKDELLQMEANIIKTLDFNLVFNTSYNFLQPFCRLLEYQPKKFYLAQYILELALLDAHFLKYRQSMLACATIYLINKIKKSDCAWPDIIVAASGYNQKELRLCARQLCEKLQSAESDSKIKSLRRKFSLPKYCQVSKIRVQKRGRGKNGEQ